MFPFFKPFLFIFFFLPSLCVSQNNKIAETIDAARIEMDPDYIYDGFTLTHVTLDETPRVQQVKFVALKGQDYKIIFCHSGIKEEVTVSAFKEEKKGKLSEDLMGTTTLIGEYIELIIKKAGTYIFEYHIPSIENGEHGACKDEAIVALISYKK